jgi:flagellin
MGVVVNTNISSITASRILAENRADLEKAMERLASGKRINSAADDAAGMAVSAKMRADIRSLNQSVRNVNDAISLVNTYDGAASEIESILIRMRELAVQTSNGTYEAADRTNADYEYQALKAEITRIAGVSAFNRSTLGQGATAANGTTGSADTAFSFYVGADVAKTGNSITFSAKALDLNKAVSTDTLNSVVTTASSQQAIASLDSAITELAANRAEAGALVNRLEHTVSNLMNVSQRLQEAVSGIEDADYAAESANLARGMVLAQAGTAMLAQANQAPQYILSLLRG